MFGNSRRESHTPAAIERLSRLIPEIDSGLAAVGKFVNAWFAGEHSDLSRLEASDADFCVEQLYDRMALARGYFEQVGIGPDAEALLRDVETLRDDVHDYGVELVRLADATKGKAAVEHEVLQASSELHDRAIGLNLDLLALETAYGTVKDLFARFGRPPKAAAKLLAAQDSRPSQQPAPIQEQPDTKAASARTEGRGGVADTLVWTGSEAGLQLRKHRPDGSLTEPSPAEYALAHALDLARACNWLHYKVECVNAGGRVFDGDLPGVLDEAHRLWHPLNSLRESLADPTLRQQLSNANQSGVEYAGEVGASYVEAVFLAGERLYSTINCLCRHGLLYPYLSRLHTASSNIGEIFPQIPKVEEIEYSGGHAGCLRSPAVLLAAICREVKALPTIDPDQALVHLKKEIARMASARSQPVADAMRQPAGEALLTKEAAAVLCFLNERHPVLATLDDIEAGADLSRATAQKARRELIELGYANQPKGKNKGVAATKAGLAIAAKLITKSAQT